MKTYEKMMIGIAVAAFTFINNGLLAAGNQSNQKEMQTLKLQEIELAAEYLEIQQDLKAMEVEMPGKVQVYNSANKLVLEGTADHKDTKLLILQADFLMETDGTSIYRLNN
jgi:hypothetical protein